jgi:hypothetical protein
VKHFALYAAPAFLFAVGQAHAGTVAVVTLNDPNQYTDGTIPYPLEVGWERPQESTWIYYLEGEIRNRDVELRSLPQPFAAPQRGQYFVHFDDREVVADRVWCSLRSHVCAKVPRKIGEDATSRPRLHMIFG